MKQLARFTSPDSSETLTIAVLQGKRGYNLRVTKKEHGKSAPRAEIGCRASYKTEAEAQKAFDRLFQESLLRGWHEQKVSSRSAFSTIPEPRKSVKAVSKKVVTR